MASLLGDGERRVGLRGGARGRGEEAAGAGEREGEGEEGGRVEEEEAKWPTGGLIGDVGALLLFRDMVGGEVKSRVTWR